MPEGLSATTEQQATPPVLASRQSPDYVEAPIRAFTIATVFWGLAAFAAGVYIALQLAFPALNLGLEYTTFGRLRPLHTSAVIFAFGGNALLGTSLYVVQRTCRARLFGGDDAGWFLFWGYQFFIVIAALGYLMGITQSKEYAEPEWYADLWLTVVWVFWRARITRVSSSASAVPVSRARCFAAVQSASAASASSGRSFQSDAVGVVISNRMSLTGSRK